MWGYSLEDLAKKAQEAAAAAQEEAAKLAVRLPLCLCLAIIVCYVVGMMARI